MSISAYSHPTFSQENVKGSSNYEIIKSGRSLDLAYQLGAMTSRGYSRDSHANLADLLGAMTIKGLTHPAPSYIRGGEKGELSYIRGGVMGIIAMTMVGVLSFNVQAECTPTPDCVDMGYTETSCSGSFVRCPFDTSKLFCAPCDSKFQYTCLGDYIAGGEGNSCDNKYISCACAFGATFSNGNCICDTSCSVGNIYYSDKTCSSCVNNAKTAIGIVIKNDELIMSIDNPNNTMSWSNNTVNISTLSDYSSYASAKTDYAGKNNTQLLVNHYGASASGVAGVHCYNYSTTGTSANSWYLPATGETFDYIYGNKTKIVDALSALGKDTAIHYIWTSTEYGIYGAWFVNFYTGVVTDPHTKTNQYYVACFLNI